MPLWASWLRDFDILNIFYDEFKSKKMAKFETLIVPRGISKLSSAVISGKGDQIGRNSVLTTDGQTDGWRDKCTC